MSTGLQQLKAFRIKPTIVETFTTEEIYSNISHYLDKMDITTEAYYQTLELSKRVSTESNDYKIILEGFIDSIVDAIKGAINWVIKLIKDFISWVGSLFSGKKKGDEDDGNSPSDEEVKKAIEVIQKAKNTAPESDPLKKHKALYHAFAEQSGIYDILKDNTLKYNLLVPVINYSSDRIDTVECPDPLRVFAACNQASADLCRITKGASFNIAGTDAKFITSITKYHKEDKPDIYGRVIIDTFTTPVTSENGILKFGTVDKSSNDAGAAIAKVTDENIISMHECAKWLYIKLATVSVRATSIEQMQQLLKITEDQLTTLLSTIEVNINAGSGEPTERHAKIMNVKLLTQSIAKALGHQLSDSAFRLKNSNMLRKTIVKISQIPDVALATKRLRSR